MDTRFTTHTFLFFYLIALIYNKNTIVKQCIDKLHFSNVGMFRLVTKLNDKYDEEEFKNLMEQNQFYKLTYKTNFSKDGTFYEKIVEGR